MTSTIGRFCGVVLVAATCCAAFSGLAETARAGGHHHTAWGQKPECGSTGCGPRYRGAQWDEPACLDPCDACNRWRACNGVGEMPDMLAPWQLPPGRGFQRPEAFGYHTGPCTECRAPCWSCWLPRSWWH